MGRQRRSAPADPLGAVLTASLPLSDGRQDDGSLISVFVFDASLPYAGRADRRAYIPIAKNALKKIRSTRHPDMYVPTSLARQQPSVCSLTSDAMTFSLSLKFLDAHETESVIHIATERVQPILTIIAQTSPAPEADYLIWGLHRVTVGRPACSAGASSD